MIIVRDLKIFPKFENEIRRLTEEEFKNLTERILEDGAIREKIIVWEGTDYIVDGHHRYKIAMEYNIPFDVLEMAFDDERDARRWININAARSKGRLLNPNERTECIGRAYNLSKKDHGGTGANRYTVLETNQNDKSVEPWTIQIIANDFGVGEATVQRAAEFVEVLDEIKEKTGPEILEIVRSEPKKTQVQHLEFINNEVENNPVVLKQVFETDPYIRTKWIKFYRGKICSERDDDATVQDIADRFKISKSAMEDDLRFAKLLLVLPEDMSEWVINESGIPVGKIIEYFEGESPGFIEATISNMFFSKPPKPTLEQSVEIVKSKDPKLVENFGKYDKLTETIEKNAKTKMKEFFGHSNGGCIMPNAFEMWCNDCEFGFDTFIGKDVKFCPYCGQSNIEKRATGWYPGKVD